MIIRFVHLSFFSLFNIIIENSVFRSMNINGTKVAIRRHVFFSLLSLL